MKRCTVLVIVALISFSGNWIILAPENLSDLMASYLASIRKSLHYQNLNMMNQLIVDSRGMHPIHLEKDNLQHQFQCPHIQEMVPNNKKHLGFKIPYRLGQSRVNSAGVGVYTLSNVKSGDIIWHFHNHSFLFLEQDNWLQLLEDQVRKRNWKNAPELDALWDHGLATGWDPGDLNASIPDELVLGLLMMDWHWHQWPLKCQPKDEEDVEDEEKGTNCIILYQLDDNKYVNHGPYGTKEANMAKTHKFQNLATVDSHGYLMALKDIPACTELLENYWYGEENIFLGENNTKQLPTWYISLLDKYEGLRDYFDNPPYKFTSTTEANIGY